MKNKIFDEKMGGRTGHGLHFVFRLLQVTGMGIREAPEPGKGARFVIQVPKCCVRSKRTNVVLREK
ncbi:MAG: HAMP domain-containing histidine kinase [Methanomassiliicoccus sp.]|nr:MAG: HAMP domain-containing histidine kinase [Methanomassiliicoccus sp.]